MQVSVSLVSVGRRKKKRVGLVLEFQTRGTSGQERVEIKNRRRIAK